MRSLSITARAKLARNECQPPVDARVATLVSPRLSSQLLSCNAVSVACVRPNYLACGFAAGCVVGRRK